MRRNGAASALIEGFFVMALAFSAFASGRPASPEKHLDLDASSSQRTMKQAPAARSGSSAALKAVLAANPALKARIVWVTGDGKQQPFDSWTSQMKSRMEAFCQKFVSGDSNLGMHLPTVDKIDSASACAFFTADQAFEAYAANVAHVLYVEAKGLVPWSIAKRPAAELDILLASPSYFARIRPSSNTNYPAGIKANRDFAEPPEDEGIGELNGDPREGFDFVSGKTSALHQRLIGKDELETLVHLTVWLRDNVGHGVLEDQNAHSKA